MVLGPIGGVIGGIARGMKTIGGTISGAITDNPGGEDERRRKEMLYRQAQIASGAAGRADRGYQTLGARGTGALDDLQAQAQGRNLLSTEQLRQGLQQQQAAQLSMAAGASPRNAAGAARTAAIQMGRNQAGLAGQQALAGIAERNQAQQAYGNLLQGLRGQDAQMALGQRQNAIGAYGAQNAGAPEKSWLERYGPTIQSGANLAAMASDERLKTDIHNGDKAANKALSKIGAHLYRYKDERHGSGMQLSPMAQELEGAGLGHAVIDTPAGKMVHGAKAATTGLALTAALAKRVSKLEGRK